VTADRRRTLAALTACHTINDLYGLLLPPLLPAIRMAFGLSYAQAGLVPFVSTGFSALLQPNLGYLADRRGIRKPLMVAGFAVYALAAISIGRSSDFATLLLAALLLGVGAATYHPQSATFLSYYFARNRGWAQGIHGIGNGLGFMVAPVLVAFLAERLGWHTAAMLMALPALLAAGIVAAALREPAVRGHKGMLEGITRPLVLLTVVNGLALATSNGFLTWLPSYYASQGHSLFVSGALTAAISTAALLAQPLGGALSDRLGRRNVVGLSLASAAVCLVLFLLAPTLALMVPLSLLVGFATSLLPPVMMVYASELAAGERTGMAVGIVWGLGTAFSAVSPVATGGLLDAHGFAVTYLALAAVSAVAAGLTLLLPKTKMAGSVRS
jgi:FSR family fosmidomycin resistance protein-like MFS transporter